MLKSIQKSLTLMIFPMLLSIVSVSCTSENQEAIKEVAQGVETAVAQTAEASNQTAKQIAALDAQISQSTIRGELLTDRCSAATYISPEYPGPEEPTVIDELNGILLIRDENNPDAGTGWSHKMPVTGNEWIRWYCNSTTGNFLDPGTWRILEAGAGVKCEEQNDGGYVCGVEPQISIELPDDWTAERSRCDSDNTTAISARLGPDRLLEIQCWEAAH